jgi:uncharacterized SAM-binding protein YcdF (DUF218 family)
LSKILTSFLLPPASIAALWLLGLIFAARARKRLSLAVLSLSFSLYYLCATWPVAGLLIGSLESEYPPRPLPAGPGDAEAVVVLSGGISAAGGSVEGVELSGSTWRRLSRGAEVFHALNGKLPLIFSGHEELPAGWGDREPPWRAAARRMGVPAELLVIEDRSADTFESAVEVKKLLDQKFPGRERHPVILVTSAWHLARAMRAYRCQGLLAAPEPADSRGGPGSLGFAGLVPSYEALAASSVALREWIGMLAYRLLKGC